jgi:CPA2 family monovalent cation:H+ antiporter-2
MSEASLAGYSDVVAFLATAGVAAPLFKRLKVSPILGFLLAGVALGPQGLAQLVPAAPWLAFFTVSEPAQISGFAELGVVFLLFSIGLELSWERLRLMRRMVFGLGAAQTLVSAALIAGAGLLLGAPRSAALSLGAALALSSTAVVVPVMAEAGRLHAPSGRAVFSTLLFQDLAVAPVLVALSMFGVRSGGSNPFLSVASAVLGLAGVIVAGRLILRPLFGSAARAKSQDLFLALSFLVVIGAGVAARLLGFSMALGAFVAGLLLAETEFRHEIEVLLGPFRNLLLGLFFLSVGLGLDLAMLTARPWPILAVALGFLILKGLTGAGLTRAFGIRGGAALETGLLLAAAGEFAFVVIAQAQEDGLLAAAQARALSVSATLTMFAIPVLGSLGARLGRGQDADEAARAAAPPEIPEAEPRVLVVGYGRVGQLVCEMLDRHQIAWTAVERNFKAVEAARRSGARIFYGDASRPELLLRCGLAAAPGVVLTTDEPEAAETVAAAVRRLRPDVVLVARARDARHASRLYELGASDAVPETVEASLQLSEATLVDLGVPMGFVIASIHEKRDEIRKVLSAAKNQRR